MQYVFVGTKYWDLLYMLLELLAKKYEINMNDFSL